MKASQMTRSIAVAIVMLLPITVNAAEFDGSAPLLCSIIDVVECSPGGECLRSDASGVNLPYFVKIDLSDQVIRVPQGHGDSRTTPIREVTHLDGKLILQGAEEASETEQDAVGWTMSIDEDDGRMIFSASRDQVGFVIFGACTKP
ncbi:MAG: hypothetical protein JRF07_07280 [Deltaproteobacteria bacterium]|jgi:hypothetical protein|nr:hypothetical protein [Deltaproteobacteria bacterium]